MRIPVELSKAYRLLNHGPTVLVTSAASGRTNVMAAAWNMALDFMPCKVAVVIDKNTYTKQLVDESGVFALSVPCRAQAQATVDVGSISANDLPDRDKFAKCGIIPFASSLIDVPLVEGCVAWLECRVIVEPQNQERYDLYLGEVVAAWADDRVFSDGRWHFEGFDELRTIHYVAGGQFFATGDVVEATKK
jgi:flavin reductase (DIM6/NTAB) family NADH-FMN oxidoreductase RutF